MAKEPGKDQVDVKLDDVKIERRVSRWRDTMVEAFYPHEGKPLTNDFHTGQLFGTSSRDLKIATFASDPIFNDCTAGNASEAKLDGFFVSCLVEGKSCLTQRGREVALQPGQFSFTAIYEAHAYNHPVKARTVGLVLPGSALRSRRPDIEDCTALDLARAGAVQNMFFDYAHSLSRNALDLDENTLNSASTHLADLLCLVVDGADASSENSAIQAAHRRRAQQFIEANLSVENLGLALVSQAVGVSERYLQKIYTSSGISLTASIRKRRMLEACRLLDQRSKSRASIAMIAFRTGFSDPAHFSRVFRREIGMSPLEWSVRSAHT